MGFCDFESAYDWSRLKTVRQAARQSDFPSVDLSVGTPVDPVPDAVCEALGAAADFRGYPPAAGTCELTEAISGWFKRVRGVDLEKIEAAAIPSIGSKEAIALMACLLGFGRGDVIVQPRVSYPTYAIGTQLAGSRIEYADDVSDTNSWRNVENVKAVWINSPCNPSGEVYSKEQLRKIVEAARQIGAIVLSDECYACLTWENPDCAANPDCAENAGCAENQYCACAPSASILDEYVCGGKSDGILCLYSLSKQSNLGAYRTAFIAGDKSIINRLAMFRRQIGQMIPGPVQNAFAAALNEDKTAEKQREIYKKRLEKLVEALKSFGYDAKMPAGGLYVWVKALSGDCWTDLEILAKKTGIVASPGEFYADSSYVRFSVTASDEDVESAAKALKTADFR